MRKGFTLVELLVTTAIIGILASIGTVSYSFVRMKARDAKRASDVQAIRGGIETYFEQHGRYPEAPSGGLTLGHENAKVLSDAGFTATGRERGLVYINNIPANVLPGGLPYFYSSLHQDGNVCVSQCFNYEFIFSLESETGELLAGPHKVTPDGVIGPENDPNYRPPSFLAQYVPSPEDVAAAFGRVGELNEFRAEIVDRPEVQTTAAVVTPVAATAAFINLGAAVAAAIPFASAGNVLFALVFQPLLLLGRGRRAAWGTVRNAGTSVPIDLATVRLVDAATNRAAAVKVSDKDGRYAMSPRPGAYRIEAVKAGFEPYHGTLVRVERAGETVAIDIRLEPTREAAETPRKERTRGLGVRKLIAFGGPAFGFLVFVASPSALTILLLALHLAVYAFFKRLAVPPEPKTKGIVYDEASKKPVGQAVVRIFSLPYNKVLETQVTDSGGQYGFYVGNGTYYLTVTKEGFRKTETDPIDFTAVDKPTFIVSDLPLRRAT